MEFFFLNTAVQAEIYLLLILGIILVIVGGVYGYRFVERIVMIF